MGEYADIAVERAGTDGRVARVTLNRPEVLNALRAQTLGELDDALHTLEADDSARVVILAGAGRAFSVGYDIGSARAMRSPRDETHLYRAVDDDGRPLLMNFATGVQQGLDVQLYLFRMSKVTIAETHGYCVAGGLELAMMCDLLTTAANCSFGHPGHRGIGVARNGMILPLVVGMRKAKELFYTGDQFDGTAAERLGIANYAWPAAELGERTLALADRIANQTADWLALLKRGINGFYENMGLESSVRSTTVLDAMARATGSGYEWRQRLSQDGLKKAVAWRDRPYGDYGQAGGDRK